MADDSKRRSNFPDYIPMFAFPNDINVVSSDERPRSTWHGFAMTNAEGSKMYGICVIVWLPLNEKASEELERQCEEWRKKNMTNEERELAASLGERLAIERAKLSRLLARLPGIPQGSDERETLEEEITLVEEKIGLMSDLLRPVRHGAASKIEGLTDGGTGLWIPRAYGILGRDSSLTSFWKEWLKAVIVPMTNGAILRVPPSSPRVGMWQPLERFVVNLCAEAPSPIDSTTQVEISIRELRLYARKEGLNEIPGWRNVDLYALFRCLSIPNVLTLVEYVLAESRIILLSSHTSMLHLASHALLSLIYPLKWSAVFIPVLPVRLIQALEAPCPYIVGIEKRYENVDLPDDDFVIVDLDENVIESTAPPTQLPRQQRKKLYALLQHAAQHHTRYGVPVGPPAYAQETYPNNVFCSENPSVFSHRPPPSTLPALVTLNSASFSSINSASSKPLVLNAFLQARNGNSRGSEYQHRPATSSTSGNSRLASPPSPKISPVSTHFPPPSTPVSDRFPPAPSTPISRNDSGLALQATLREKRSGHFDSSSRRSSSFGFDKFERVAATRRPSQPFLHISTPSSSTLNSDFRATSSYSPSVYAQSTLAASTVMPGLPILPAFNAATCQCVEGHVFQTSPADEERSVCGVCDESGHDGDQMLRCSGCSLVAHSRCAPEIRIVCPIAFRPDQVRAAFVRLFSSLFYTYRRYLCFADHEQRKNGLLYSFNVDGFVKSLPHDCAEFMSVLRNTQGKLASAN
jgi:DENN (AEX-3) domain/uDENN domain